MYTNNTTEDTNIDLALVEEVKTLDSVLGLEQSGMSRKSHIMELVEGDILVDGNTYKRVESGEIYVNADGTIDETEGELVQVSIEAITTGFTGTLFNMEDING